MVDWALKNNYLPTYPAWVGNGTGNPYGAPNVTDPYVCSLFVQRNPNIKLYALPWAFPAWVGNGTGNPYGAPGRLATYIVKWVKGAKVVHGLHIDYIGVSDR